MIVSTLLLAALSATPLSNARSVPAGSKLSRAGAGDAASLMVGLKLHDAAGLDSLIASQHQPGSPQFRRWLTPTEFGAHFGVSGASYEATRRELSRTGLQVETYPSRLLFHAHGRVDQVERLLNVTLWDVHTPDGKVFRTYRGVPHVSDSLSPILQSLSGLDTRARYRRRYATPEEGDVFGPQDLRRFYNALPLHQQGFGGQLSRVGIVGPVPDTADLPDPADLGYFYSAMADSTVQFNVVNLGLQGSPPDDEGDKGEFELDAEMSVVAAPLEQSITMVLGPVDSMFTQGMGYFANVDYTVTAVSTSFGDCEDGELGDPSNEYFTVANLVAQGSAEGIAFFAAAGDDGADDCETGPIYPDGGGGDGAQVDFPGSIPYMVSVGGTTYTGNFDANDAVTSHASEAVWNDGPEDGAGGGGTSELYFKPGYQIGIGASSTFRDVPDFALMADPYPGVAVDDTYPGLIDGSGGTSASAPMAAGIFALINDYIGGCRIGAPHFELYRLGRQSSTASVFNDITSGNLNQNDVVGPAAGPGFDDASGWGSINIAALAQAWPPCTGAGTSLPPDGALFPDGGFSFSDAGLPTDGDGFYLPGEFDAGIGVLDGGPRVPFDACAILACDGGATCVTLPEGPSACVLSCNPTGANTCPQGQYCDATSSSCTLGCIVDSDCAAGNRCNLCGNVCAPVRSSGSQVGDPCSDDSQCPTFGFCNTPDPSEDLPDGYCSVFCDGTADACQCPTGSVCNPDYGWCIRTCSVSAGGPCADAQVCNDYQDGDVGVCFPTCRNDEDCDFGAFQDVCGPNGICVNPNATASSSTGSTGGTIGGSSGGETTGSGSSGSGTAGSTTGHAGSTTGGSTTGSQSPASTGCGCGQEVEAPLGLLFVFVGMLRRRRIFGA